MAGYDFKIPVSCIAEAYDAERRSRGVEDDLELDIGETCKCFQLRAAERFVRLHEADKKVHGVEEGAIDFTCLRCTQDQRGKSTTCDEEEAELYEVNL